jgi:hypothetical protein
MRLLTPLITAMRTGKVVCTACGYDVQQLPRCPECGRVQLEGRTEADARRLRWAVPVGVVLLFAPVASIGFMGVVAFLRLDLFGLSGLLKEPAEGILFALIALVGPTLGPGLLVYTVARWRTPLRQQRGRAAIEAWCILAAINFSVCVFAMMVTGLLNLAG